MYCGIEFPTSWTFPAFTNNEVHQKVHDVACGETNPFSGSRGCNNAPLYRQSKEQTEFAYPVGFYRTSDNSW